MRFKVKASELINALSVVENVTPCRISAQGGTGYLFQTHKDANGNPRCYVTSRDNYEVARGDMKFIELDEDGRFIVPTSFLDNFKYMGDDVVDFEVKADGTTNTISYRSFERQKQPQSDLQAGTHQANRRGLRLCRAGERAVRIGHPS